MRRKILGVLVCMLLIATAVPAVTSVKNSTISTMGSTTQQTNMAEEWTEIQKLLASDGAEFENFGFSVSVDGDTAVIGARYDDISRGSAYVFTRSGTTWTQQAKLLASDGAAYDHFGCSVSVDGDTALVGAYGGDQGNDSGSAYVFTRSGTTWTQQAKLLAADGEEYDFFGYSVALDGDTAVIGAPADDDMGWDSGSAYIFTREGGNQSPNTPTITGPASGKIKVAIDYNFTTIDPEGNQVSYFIEWGDGTDSGWIGPYASGDVVTKSHTWTKKGDYVIKAKAKDSNGAESGWGELSVNMPCSSNLPFMQLWERLFERFPHAFPVLRHLMGY